MKIKSWLKGIKGQLLFAAVLPVIGFGVLGYKTFVGYAALNRIIDSAHKDLIPNIYTLEEIRISRSQFSYQTSSAILDIRAGRDATEDIKAMQKNIENFDEASKEYLSTTFMDEEAKLYSKVKDDFPKISELMRKIQEQLKTGTPEALAAAETIIKGDFKKSGDNITNFNLQAVDLYKKRADQEGLQAKDTTKNIRLLSLITIGAVVFIIFAFMIWMASRISNALNAVTAKLTQSGNDVANSVEQLSAAGNTLSQSSTEAAASLEETVASLEELSSMVSMNSDNAKQAAALSASSREAAEKGQSEMNSLITSMTKISQSSKKIEEIIHVIDDIAFQTNLLALNAAVEAARAGEQGKGFAVVADAVRSLAQRSASAAKDINNLIKESVVEVEDGRKVAAVSGEALNNIVTSVKKVADLNNEIATASTEQTSGIQQISKAMNQLDQSSQANAASAEEIAASSTEINNLANVTKAITEELNRIVQGNSEGGPETPPVLAASPAKKTPEFQLPKKSAKVLSFQNKKTAPAPSAVTVAKEVIPFDEDDRAKVGTTDGF